MKAKQEVNGNECRDAKPKLADEFTSAVVLLRQKDGAVWQAPIANTMLSVFLHTVPMFQESETILIRSCPMDGITINPGKVVP